MPVPDNKLQRAYRVRVSAFLACTGLLLCAGFTGSQVIGTLHRLDAVEADRDRWQHADEIIAALGLHNGATVTDLGCGSGYFTLRLSPAAGPNGTVLAEDIRRLPLMFLRVRALLRHEQNIRIILGTADEPGLPVGTVDAVLIANTYHEFAHPELILRHVRRALRPGGRLVIVDREPGPGGAEAGEHRIAAGVVEGEIVQAGFMVSART